jgi:hypothetical protein
MTVFRGAGLCRLAAASVVAPSEATRIERRTAAERQDSGLTL